MFRNHYLLAAFMFVNIKMREIASIKEIIKKVIYKELKKLPEYKVLYVYPELRFAFYNLTGKELEKYLNILNESIEEIEELQKQKYSGEIRKAINFDERIKIMEKDEPLFIFINFLHAQQIQIGRKNIINNNFVKEPEKGESILSKLKNFFKSYIFDFRFDSKFFKMVKNLFS